MTRDVHLSADEEKRLERIDGLAAMGPPGIDELLELLTERSWVLRRAVVSALASMGDAAVTPLRTVLTDRRDDEARLAATVDALAASTGSADGMAVSLTTHPDPAVVADAAQIIGRRHYGAAVPTLIALMQHPNDNVAVAAVEALGRIGGRAAVDSLVATVKSGNFFRVFPAIDVLGRSGDPRAVGPLAELLESSYVALEAARALGRTGDKRAVGPLVSLLGRSSDATARVGGSAIAELLARSLERTGETAPAEEALRAAAGPNEIRRLVHCLAGADPTEQIAICQILGILGGEAAVAALARMLSAQSTVAQVAAESLRRASAGAERELATALDEGDSARRLIVLPQISRPGSIAAVLRCLEDPDPAVRAAACDALARIGSPTAVQALFRLLAEQDPRVAQAAVAAIQSLGSLETERLALEAARSGFPTVRRAAFRIIGYFGYPSSLDLVVGAIRDPDPRVRDAAVQALPFLLDPAALEALLEAVKDKAERLRAAAARALGQCRGDVRVASALLKGVRDGDPWVRYYACQSLGRLGVETATAAIASLIDDPAGQVRVSAIEALSHLRGENAFEALRIAAESPDPDVQRAALVGLGISRRPEAEPILFRATASPDAATRLVAVSAIADFDVSDAFVALGRAAKDSDLGVRTAAIGFLGARSGVEATRALVHLLDGVEDRERVLAALTTPVEGRVEALVTELLGADDDLAAHIVAALSRMRRPDSDAALLRALETGPIPARKAAAVGVAALNTKVAFTALRHAARDDADAEVRRVASLLLAE